MAAPTFGDVEAISLYILPDRNAEGIEREIEAARSELKLIADRWDEIEHEIEELQIERLDCEDDHKAQEKVIEQLERELDDARFWERMAVAS
jgi:predicted  nucleic acid-binding Zn-ribbon protein